MQAGSTYALVEQSFHSAELASASFVLQQLRRNKLKSLRGFLLALPLHISISPSAGYLSLTFSLSLSAPLSLPLCAFDTPVVSLPAGCVL